MTHCWWMFSILAETPEQRDGLRNHLAIEGIETRPLFNPVHKMPMYGTNAPELPITDNISCRGMNLPSWPGMSESMLMRVIDAIRNFYL